METEKSSQTSNYYEPSNRYMIDTRKHYLLASNKDSLESLLKNQSEQLRKVLMDLKAEYDYNPNIPPTNNSINNEENNLPDFNEILDQSQSENN